MYDSACEVVSIIRNAGYEAYFVGGWVRDMLIGQRSPDIDIATNASTDVINSLFDKTIPLGESFGVIVVQYKNTLFEIASFRTDGDYIDGRRPNTINTGTLEQDIYRRDFTINGLFYNPINKEIIDLVGGKDDINNKIIRCIGNPHHRFNEDRLRMIRCVRFATKFNFNIHIETLDAIIANSYLLLPSVSIERVWQELCKFTCLYRGFVELHRYNLLQQIFPILINKSIDDIERLAEPISRYPSQTPTILKIMALFRDSDTTKLPDICTFLKATKRDRVLCNKLMELQCTNITLVQWAYLYADNDTDLLLSILAEHEIDKDSFLEIHYRRKSLLNSHVQRIINKKPLVTSAMLLSRGVKSGPRLGQLLKDAETIAINMNIHNSEEIIELLNL